MYLPQESLLSELDAHAEQTRNLVNRVQDFVDTRRQAPLPEGHAPHTTVTDPGRWAVLAQTDLQSGFMKLRRALHAPSSF